MHLKQLKAANTSLEPGKAATGASTRPVLAFSSHPGVDCETPLSKFRIFRPMLLAARLRIHIESQNSWGRYGTDQNGISAS